MFRQSTATPPNDQHDTLIAGALPDRVQTARERLAHQHDPALLAALSERELASDRELAELVREHQRTEKRAQIRAAADAAERVRTTAASLADREAADLLRAAQAIGEQRHSSSPHAKVARLHRRKPRVLALFAGVVAFSMLFSAVTVQQNIAPGMDTSNPMFWLSYGLEALISAVLVGLMISTADTSEYDVLSKEKLRQVYLVEAALLLTSIGLNTFPYIRAGDVTGFGVHVIAPVMIGVALISHRLVAERYGRAIEAATAEIPTHDNLQARLVALTQVGDAANQIVPAILTTDRADQDDAEGPRAEDAVSDEVTEAHTQQPRATEAPEPEPIARDDESARDADRAPIARDENTAELFDRAPLARDIADPARGIIAESIARAAYTARDTDDIARAADEPDTVSIARDEQPVPDAERALSAAEDAVIARAEITSIAAHTPAELGTDRGSIAAHDLDTTPSEAVDTVTDEEPRADETAAGVEVAREQDAGDRARTAPIALVSIAREDTDRARGSRADRARESSTAGALARATEPAPIARDTASRAGDSGPFARVLSRAEAERYARAMRERGLSKQPESTLTEILLLASQGYTANAIGARVGLAHSTVGRALSRVEQVVGPRAI
ncbi:hypothetical protein ACFYTF_30775 [Nocardia thailandica]|uniref:HTH luxR-type domain-containing protein n=1 Tax=Nocardia thailandica TaxID=257275 RepID=A0ABW6PXP9_9NOCA